MKFFHVYYTLYDTKATFIDYGIKSIMCEVFPQFHDAHDQISINEKPHRVAINNIKEVTKDEYYVNLDAAEQATASKKYFESVLGKIRVLDADEMRELGLDEDRMEEIQFAVAESLEQAVDFDVLIMRFISSVIKQFAEGKCATPPQEYFDRFNITNADIDKQTRDEMVMAYKVDLAKLADRFDTLIDTLDDSASNVHYELYSAFIQLSRMLPGMWN